MYTNYIQFKTYIQLIQIITQLSSTMFNPHQFIKPTTPHTGRIILERLTDHSKSRWDQPITVPHILYQKFKIAVPQSATAAKQTKKYPLSLIDYIKRAYDKCKDQMQARTMETQLRKVIARHEENLQGVNWEIMTLPIIQESKKNLVSAVFPKKEVLAKHEMVNLQKQYLQNLGLERTDNDNSSKAKIKVSKTLQKLQQKLTKKQQGIVEPQEKKMFVGFKSQPDNYLQSNIRSEISPHLRTLFLSSPPPPPPNNTKKDTPTHQNAPYNDDFDHKGSRSGNLSQRFVRSHENSSDKLLNVITSTKPEPLSFKSSGRADFVSPDANSKNSKHKEKANIVITKKQLSQIQKVAQNKGQLHNVAKRYESFHKLKTDSIKNIEEYDDEIAEEIIIGKSTCIDKPYLRITGRPDPQSVRPLTVLKKALAHFLQEHKKGTTPYDSLISQLKSIRQDLTVQHIRDSFTVQAYEQNFKMSLFQNDFIQVKQCQANLWQLYRQGLYYTIESRNKFISLNLITLILEGKYKDLEYMLTFLPEGTLQHEEVQGSLSLKKHLQIGNYRAFFDFYNSRDQLSRKLLNIYVDKVRMKCIVMFCKTCGQKISFKSLSDWTGEDEDVIESLCVGQGGIVRQGFFMLKQSYQKLSTSEYLMVKKVTNLLI